MTSRRDAQAALTRDDIVRAAGRLLLRHGYVATSIGAIAAEAQVAVQTIYNSVGSKAELVAAVLERAATAPGSAESVATAMRERIASARSPAEAVAAVADGLALVNERTAGILHMVGEAAVIDVDVAAFAQRRDEGHLGVCVEIAGLVRAHGARQPGRGPAALPELSDLDAGALIFTASHHRPYRTFVHDIGWSTAGYRDWLERVLGAALT
ncbi:MAG: TetR/AcrR family transcriptional regulator [Cryobacterium sp.]